MLEMRWEGLDRRPEGPKARRLEGSRQRKASKHIQAGRQAGRHSPSASGNILRASPAILSAAPSIPDTPLTSRAARLDARPSGSRSASASDLWYGTNGLATSSNASRTEARSSADDAASPAPAPAPAPGASFFLAPDAEDGAAGADAKADPRSIASYARDRNRSVAPYAAATASVPPPSAPAGPARSPRPGPGAGQRFPSLLPKLGTMGRNASASTRTTMAGARSGPNTCRLCCRSRPRRSRTDS